jgi:ADP-ribose pyrophosphatase
LPAGTRARGEEEDTTARRELIEETGYEAGAIERIASYYSSAGFSNEQLTLFLASDCTSVEREDDPDEHTEVVLVPRREIGRFLEPGRDEIRDAKSLIGLLWLNARYNSARNARSA